MGTPVSSTPPTNLINNGDFTSGQTSWYGWNDNWKAPGTQAIFKFVNAGQTVEISNSWNPPLNTIYAITFTLKMNLWTSGLKIMFGIRNKFAQIPPVDGTYTVYVEPVLGAGRGLFTRPFGVANINDQYTVDDFIAIEAADQIPYTYNFMPPEKTFFDEYQLGDTKSMSFYASRRDKTRCWFKMQT